MLTGARPASTHVIWFNIGEFEDDRAEVNEVLRAAATSATRTWCIVDWNSWWEQDDSLTSGDRLHLTPDGAQAYAALVAASVLQVTEAAGEIPAPGAKPPKLNTSGRSRRRRAQVRIVRVIGVVRLQLEVVPVVQQPVVAASRDTVERPRPTRPSAPVTPATSHPWSRRRPPTTPPAPVTTAPAGPSDRRAGHDARRDHAEPTERARADRVSVPDDLLGRRPARDRAADRPGR